MDRRDRGARAGRSARRPGCAGAVGGRDDRVRPTASASSARWSCSTRRARAAAPVSRELWTDAARRPTLLIGLVVEREQLYREIDARVDRMLAAGVER